MRPYRMLTCILSLLAGMISSHMYHGGQSQPGPGGQALSGAVVPVAVAKSRAARTPRHALQAGPEELLPMQYNDGSIGPRYMPFILAGEDTAEWRAKEAPLVHRYPVSIFHRPPPNVLDNTGHILVAVCSCCKSWNMTERLLMLLIAMDDPIHVVLFDDFSQDGAAEKAAALGVPVFTTGRTTGNTANMNRAWKYFTSYTSLQVMVLLNNDVLVAPKTFTKLHRCAMEAPVTGVVGPMSDEGGVGYVKFHVAAHPYSRRRFYNGLAAPEEIQQGLPDTLVAYNDWLEANSEHSSEFGRVFRVSDIFGFVMTFRKDYPVKNWRENVLLQGGVNLGQEQFLFQLWNTPAYVCSDVFVYHVKGSTLVTSATGKRGNIPGNRL